MTDPNPPLDRPSHRLERIKPRDTRAAKAHSATYSRMVGVLRWVLPLFAVLGLVLLVLWPMLGDNKISMTVVDSVPNLMVEKLHLTGIDVHNEPYSVTADRALQAANTKNIVDLEKPKAELLLQSGAWLAGQAQYGRLDQTTRKLWLGGTVELFHDNGYRFTTNEMNVDIAKSAAWGEQPVVIQGNFGEIRGSGFRLLDGGHTFIVTGPASARLSLHSGKPSDKPSVNTSQSR